MEEQSILETSNKPIFVTWFEAKERSKRRPEGYLDDLKAHATYHNDVGLEFTEENYLKLRQKYIQFQQSVPLDTKTIIKNFASATKRWAQSGFETVSKEEFTRRTKICEDCPFWSANTGKPYPINFCTKCGCTKLKSYLATEKCPIGKW